MNQAQPQDPSGPPGWFVAIAGLAIGYHLLAVSLGALAAPSGPWPTPDGANLASPPQFAYSLYQGLAADYLQSIKLIRNFHYVTNRPGLPGAYLEVHLKDKDGNVFKTVRVPDAEASSSETYRQDQLARRLADDEPVAPPQGESIPAPNQKAATVLIWDIVDNRKMKLKEVPVHLIPRERPVFRPTDFALLLARSYARHLCAVHGAAAAEIVRHSFDPIPPSVLSDEPPPEGAFGELISNFGELPQ
jgi:hypothetical protein